jgi:uncharacterized coiled-coil DUF342 family protein
MSLTNDQLLDRIVEIEEMLNDVQTALNNVASKTTVKNLAALKQQELEALRERVTTLESEIRILQAE